MANINQLQNFQGPQAGVNRVPQQALAQTGIAPTPQFGLAGAENALTTGFRGGIDALRQGSAGAAQNIGQGVTGLNQFAQPGAQAFNQQAALSGASGADAQQQAFSNFNASPGQQFLREQGEQSIINQSAALGGLGGGDVRRELARFGTGLAQQDFGNQFNRLGQVSGQGLQAQGQIGNLLGQQAQMNQQTGANAANLFTGTGQNLAGFRSQAGRDIASQVGQSTSALANLASQQGAGLSDIIGGGAGNLAGILSGAGQFTAQQQTQLAQILANISTGTGTQLSNNALSLGNLQSQNALAQGANTQQLLGNLTSAAGIFAGNQTPPPAAIAQPVNSLPAATVPR